MVVKETIVFNKVIIPDDEIAFDDILSSGSEIKSIKQTEISSTNSEDSSTRVSKNYKSQDNEPFKYTLEMINPHMSEGGVKQNKFSCLI